MMSALTELVELSVTPLPPFQMVLEGSMRGTDLDQAPLFISAKDPSRWIPRPLTPREKRPSWPIAIRLIKSYHVQK
jgi:hypothetical protein